MAWSGILEWGVFLLSNCVMQGTGIALTDDMVSVLFIKSRNTAMLITSSYTELVIISLCKIIFILSLQGEKLRPTS